MRPASSQMEGIGLAQPLVENENGLPRRTICVVLFFLIQVGIVLNIATVLYQHHTLITICMIIISGILISQARQRFLASWPLAIIILTELAYLGIGTLTSLSLEPDLPGRAWWVLRMSAGLVVIMYGTAVTVPEVLRHLGLKTTLTYMFALIFVGVSTVFFSDFLSGLMEHAPRISSMQFDRAQQGIYRKPTQIVALSGMLATISLVFLGHRQNRVVIKAGYVGLAIAISAILVTASKTGLVALLILLTTFLLLGNQMRKIRMISLFLCLLLGLAVIMPMGLANRFITLTHVQKFFQIVALVSGDSGILRPGSTLFSSRDILWKRSFDAFLESPITGNGLHTQEADSRLDDPVNLARYRRTFNDPFLSNRYLMSHLYKAGAHNMFLGIAAEAGFVPASLLILFWLIVAYSALFRMSGPAKELTIGFSILLFCAFMTSVGFFNDVISVNIIGFICGLIKHQEALRNGRVE